MHKWGHIKPGVLNICFPTPGFQLFSWWIPTVVILIHPWTVAQSSHILTIMIFFSDLTQSSGKNLCATASSFQDYSSVKLAVLNYKIMNDMKMMGGIPRRNFSVPFLYWTLWHPTPQSLWGQELFVIPPSFLQIFLFPCFPSNSSHLASLHIAKSVM